MFDGTEKSPEPLPVNVVTTLKSQHLKAPNLNEGALCHQIINAEAARCFNLTGGDTSPNMATSIHDFLGLPENGQNETKTLEVSLNYEMRPQTRISQGNGFVRGLRCADRPETRVSFNTYLPVNGRQSTPHQALRRHQSLPVNGQVQAELLEGVGGQTRALEEHSPGRRSSSSGLVRHGSIANRNIDRKLTWVSCYIMTMYILSHVWKLIPNIYDAWYGFDENGVWPDWLQAIQGISHIMVVINSAVNFLPYLLL